MRSSKKKMTLKEVKAPDEFLTSMQRVIMFLQLYGGWIVAGAAVLLIAIVAGIFLSRRHEGALVEKALAFRAAFAPLVAVEDAAGEETTEEARKKAVEAASQLEKYATEHEGSTLAGLAWSVRGAALLLAGEAAAAMESLERGLEIQKDTPWKPVLLEVAATAADAAGAREEAERYYTEMTRAGSRLFRAMGYLHLGDLYNPMASVGGEPGDVAKAREMYQKGLAEVSGDEVLLTPAERLTRSLHEQRLSALP